MGDVVGKMPAVDYPSAQRPAVIKAYLERKAEDLQRMFAQVEDRNDAMRALNKQYGFQDSDGHYSNGKRSSELEYAEKAGAIEAAFRKVHYKDPKHESEAVRSTLSLHEYFTVDNADTIASQHLIEFATANLKDVWANFAKARAVGDVRSFVERYGTMGSVVTHVEHAKFDFKYRARRCYRLFRLSRFDLGARRTIGRFRADYFKHLDAELDRLTVGRTASTGW